MNKFGIVLGVAAVVTLAGCKDPDYQHANTNPSQGEVKSVDTTPVEKPFVIETTTPKCKCLPGAKHTTPCTCGDPDCKCVVETKPVIVAPAAPETTVYIVQNGDYLAKISKKFNVTISAIKRLNNMQSDMLRVGQKLKLPGKIDVGEQKEPAKVVTPSKKTVKKSTPVFSGATKEYVVKNGDTLGSIALGSGINVRQLKALNNLTSDSLKIGQKLKVPAEKVVKVAAEKKSEKAVAPSVAAEKKVVAPVAPAAVEKKAEEAAPVAPVVEEKKEEIAPAPVAEVKKPAAPATTTYVVQEGDDMTGVSIRWGVSAADIRELNNLGEGDQLVPGQIIKLPADAQQ